MRDLIKFIKSTGIYLVGSVLTKIISFIMIPIYTEYLSPADFGTYDLNMAYITFLSSVLFLDIWGGIMRFMFDYEERESRTKPVYAGMVIFGISTIIYTIAVFVLGNIFGIEYKFLLFLFGLLANLQQVVGHVARGYGKNFIFAVGGLAGSFITIICNIIFIAVFKKGYEFLYVSSCIGFGINIILIGSNIHIIKKLKKSTFSLKLFREMYIFAAPLCINSIAYWFLTSYNKVVIKNNLSIDENGYYAIANKFSGIMQLFTQCFQLAWQELTFSKAGSSKEEMDKFYTIAVNEYIKFLFVGLIILIPSIKIVFPYMVDNSYMSAADAIPFALLATSLSCISTFLGSICGTIKKSRFIFTTTIFGTIVNMITIHILINPLGVQAASIALFTGYFVIVIRRICLVNKYIKIKIKIKILAFLTILCFVSCYCYFKYSALINAISMILMCCIAVVLYRQKILIIIYKLSGR